ncbi:MAG TPA: molybdopterin-guanine dinucleotide biosynthesis protein B [Casimicrobiaceae bacterium]|jgi:molybdopterin-guanine dinucleotide biosynthesis protein B
MTPRVFGFAGWSGSGKTTLIERVIPRLVARGLTVSLVKHAHHEFDIDQPGKDSFRHRVAGCTEVLVSSSRRWALMHELRGADELTLGAALARLSPCDLVLVEGYKRSRLPKLEVYRAEVAKPWLHPDDPSIVGIASDVPPGPSAAGRPFLPLDGYDEIATFVTTHARLAGPAD